jgi:hypothetical protein
MIANAYTYQHLPQSHQQLTIVRICKKGVEVRGGRSRIVAE